MSESVREESCRWPEEAEARKRVVAFGGRLSERRLLGGEWRRGERDKRKRNAPSSLPNAFSNTESGRFTDDGIDPRTTSLGSRTSVPYELVNSAQGRGNGEGI
jgi:hypothetical protein